MASPVSGERPSAASDGEDTATTVSAAPTEAAGDGTSSEGRGLVVRSVDGAGTPRTVNVGVQAWPRPRYRLRFLPVCGCPSRDEWRCFGCGAALRLAGRWALSQCGLGFLLLAWALLGAAAFHAAESPHERRRAADIRDQQLALVRDLAAELAAPSAAPPAPSAKDAYATAGAAGEGSSAVATGTEGAREAAVAEYMRRHESLLLDAVADGYGEGGGGRIWSYAGCLLFAVSLLTTLGFGAPVPRTTGGRVTAVVFAAVGIPLHLLLVVNVGALAAVRLQRLAARAPRARRACSPPPRIRHGPRHGPLAVAPPPPRPVCWPQLCCCCRRGEKSTCTQQGIHPSEDPVSSRPASASPAPSTAGASARWLSWLPAVAALLYYIVGVIAFGAARERPFSACLLFPLDFTAAGGVGRTPGPLRALYAAYLEGAVLLAATGAALLQSAASRGLTALGLRLGLLTDAS